MDSLPPCCNLQEEIGGFLLLLAVILLVLLALSFFTWRYSLLTRLRLWLSNALGLRKRTDVPIYWYNADKNLRKARRRTDPDFFDDTYPVSLRDREVLQALLDITAGDSAAMKFRLVRAERVENSAVWCRYQKKAAKVGMQRGKCTFAGRGAPSTVGVLRKVAPSRDLDGGLTQELEEDICEVYLWHGTSPATALKIAQGGFEVSHMGAGKRFGSGGYFSEDPTKAHAYAGTGEGLYKNCYAMLLCRVILGKQHRTDEFRAEGATTEATWMKRHDSTLAEPRGASFREFVVFKGSQVYPEYALVYEPVEAGQECKRNERGIRHWGASNFEAAHCELPSYWFHAHDADIAFHTTHPDEQMLPVVQSLMDSTWDAELAQARVTAEVLPRGLHALKVLRMEDSKLWREYTEMQDTIRQARHNDAVASFDVSNVRTSKSLSRWRRRHLSTDVNEVFLWHGTSPAAVLSIAEKGLPVQLHEAPAPTFGSGSSASVAGRLFGNGAYFSECASLADEASSEDTNGYFEGHYAMLLCRVTLGRVQHLFNTDAKAHARVGTGHEFDSTVGERHTAGRLVREFVVPQRAQIYPEYAIIFERDYDEEGLRLMELAGSEPSTASVASSASDSGSSADEDEDEDEEDSEVRRVAVSARNVSSVTTRPPYAALPPTEPRRLYYIG